MGCGVIVALLGARSFNQALTWRNRITLYSHAVSINPDSAASYNMLGFGYQLARQADLAGAAYQRSLQLDPDEVGVRRNLAMNLMDRGLYSAALDQWRRIARTNVPDRRRHAADLEQVGIALVMMGRAREAIPPLREAYKSYPDSRIQQWLDRARRAATEPATRSLR
jgi:tetratricopeptide (TPR) repeat protein